MIFKDSYRAQEERIEKLIALFKNELTKNEVTLTPRKLFFEILGGAEKYNSYIQEENLTPWQIFEFCMGDYNGVGKYFNGLTFVENNFNVLYDFPILSIEDNNKKQLKKIQEKYPSARLVIKCDTGWGNTLSIRGSLPGINWETNTSLKNINQNTWILESEDEIEEGEYKIYINKSIEEKNSLIHKIESGFQSKIVFANFSGPFN